MTTEMRLDEMKRRLRNARSRLQNREFPKIQAATIRRLALCDISNQLRGALVEAQPDDLEVRESSQRGMVAAQIFHQPDLSVFPLRSDADIQRRRTAIKLMIAPCASRR